MGFEIEAQASKANGDGVVQTSFNKVGTVTFVKEDSKEFAALGHSTTDAKVNHVNGSCYNVDINGINKSESDKVGNIVACINKNCEVGSVSENSSYGVFGVLDNVPYGLEKTVTTPWYGVKKGKANILISLDGGPVRSYDVEIVGVDYLDKNKNIKIKVEDEELMKKTGGVVQGMSGAPLMQDGKLVGAVNYASTDDTTIAYAIFVDKLL